MSPFSTAPLDYVHRIGSALILTTIALTSGAIFTIKGPQTKVAPVGDKVFEIQTGSGASKGWCNDLGQCSFSGSLRVQGALVGTGSSTVTAAQGLTLVSTNVLRLSDSFSGTALEIMGTASGRILHAQDFLTSSGKVLFDNGDTASAALRIDSIGNSTAPHILLGYQDTFDTNLYRSAANTLRTDDNFYSPLTISGSTVTGSGGRVNFAVSTPIFSVIASGTLVYTGATLAGDWSMPNAGKILWCHQHVDTASSDGLTEIDVRINTTSIYTTKSTIDGTELDSDSAVTPAVINEANSSYDVGDELRMHVTKAGGATRAKGLKIRCAILKTFIPLTLP